MTLNHWVVGSSPTGVTKPNGKIKQIAGTKTVSAIFVMSLSGRMTYIVGFRGVQFVNSLNREQFVHDGSLTKRNFLIFCVFLWFATWEWGPHTLRKVQNPTFRKIWVDFNRILTSIQDSNYLMSDLAVFLTLLRRYRRNLESRHSWTRRQTGEIWWSWRKITVNRFMNTSSCSRNCSLNMPYSTDFRVLAYCEIGRKWLYLCNH